MICITAFSVFQILPRQIIGLFGNGSELYFTFGIRYFRTYMFCTFLNGIQPLAANFFTAIGKPAKGAFLSQTRQIIFLLPLIVILPRFLGGLEGIMYAGPIADALAAAAAVFMLSKELTSMNHLATAQA